MNEVIYKIRVNRPCRLFIDNEEVAILDENKLAKITLPEGEYLRKVVAIDNKAIYNEAEITLSGSSKLDNITLDTTGLDEAKRNALPKEPFQVGDLIYKAAEGGCGVAVAEPIDKEVTEVVIPEEIMFGHYIYEVKEIGYRAFSFCSGLTSITIPNSVTSIGEKAFCGCFSLTSITIPNSVTSIGEWAFWFCKSLTSITIPNSVTSIESSAFNGCSDLTSITIPNSVTSIGKWAFWGCYGLTHVTIPNSVTSIGEKAFDRCYGLTSITIPNSVTSIGSGALSGCSGLTSITIPNSVTSIESSAFYGCSGLTSIVVEKGNIKYDSRNNCNAIIETATNTLIRGCQNTTIPNSVTSIGSSAFSHCSGLTSITIPNSVTRIGKSAFSGCSGLTSIVVEKGNTVYDSRNNCNAIIETATNTLISGCQNTIIPNSVTRIGKGAFNGCSGLTSITILNNVTRIGKSAFSGCSGLTSIVVEKGNTVYDSRNNCNAIIETATNTLISGCQNTIIPNSVTRIGKSAFEDCTSLTSITIPNSVTSIGSHAFDGCSGLTSITIPNSVTNIGEWAFAHCNSLTSITIPRHTEIGVFAFPGHTKIIRK